MKARLTPDIRLDTVFAPFHWGAGGSANALTNPALDPVSRIPEFKVCAVRVEKVARPGRAAEPASTSAVRRTMEAAPRFLKVSSLQGRRLRQAGPLTASSPTRSRRTSGRSSSTCGRQLERELVYLLLTRDGKPMRYFPIGAKSSDHVALVVTEDIFPDTKLDCPRRAGGAPAVS